MYGHKTDLSRSETPIKKKLKKRNKVIAQIEILAWIHSKTGNIKCWQFILEKTLSFVPHIGNCKPFRFTISGRSTNLYIFQPCTTDSANFSFEIY